MINPFVDFSLETTHANALWSFVILFLFIATCQATAQPAHPLRAQEKPRFWEVRAMQRYRTMSGFAERSGSLAWYESAVSISGRLFLRGPGLLRVGTDYTHTRFAFASDTRLGASGSEPFRHVREVRLSVQLLTPWSDAWSTLALGTVVSAFEAGAAPHDALSGGTVLGVIRRLSDHLSTGFGTLLLKPLGEQVVTALPLVLVDWQITDRLALRSRQEITLTYLLGPRRRFSVAAVGAFFGRKQFRLGTKGDIPDGVAKIKGIEVGGRVIWEPSPALVVQGALEVVLCQNLRLEDRAGRDLVDVALENALRLSLVARYRF